MTISKNTKTETIDNQSTHKWNEPNQHEEWKNNAQTVRRYMAALRWDRKDKEKFEKHIDELEEFLNRINFQANQQAKIEVAEEIISLIHARPMSERERRLVELFKQKYNL